MAQKFQTLFIDDIDGGEAAETVRFALDGTEYEIDLSSAHTEELRRTLEQYVTHARRAGAGPARGAAPGAAAAPIARPTRTRSASGPGSTASRSTSGVAFRPTFSSSTVRPAANSSGYCRP